MGLRKQTFTSPNRCAVCVADFYPVRKVLRYTDGSAASSRWLEIGAMSFGDPIVVTADGKIALLDHENVYTVQLEWDSLVDFLADELSALD